MRKISTSVISSSIEKIPSVVISSGSPVLSNFTIENAQPNRIYFDSSKILNTTPTPDFNGFSIQDKTITGVNIEGGLTTGHYFTVSSAFDFWDVHSIAYDGNNSLPWVTGNTASNIQDLDGNALLDFSLTEIENNINEPTTVNVRYVSASASGSGDGLSEGAAWTMAQAVADTENNLTWVKAGTYSGTYSFPYEFSQDVKKFVGYTNIIGDITYKVVENEQPNDSIFPVFDNGNIGSGDIFGLSSRNNYIFKNLQFTNSNRAVYGLTSYNIMFENCSATSHGPLTDRSGKGFNFEAYPHAGTYGIKLIGCSVTNATGTNFRLAGNHILIKDCFSYCDQAPGGSGDVEATTDYYYQVSGSNNNIINSKAHKNTPNGDGHLGHAFAIKGVSPTVENSEYNLIDGCTAIGIYGGVQFRWGTVKRSVAKNMHIIENPVNPRATSETRSNGLTFYSGPEECLFEKSYVANVGTGITYRDNEEATSPVYSAGNNNLVRNNIFYNCEVVVYANATHSSTSVNAGNKFYNNTIDTADYFYRIKDSNMTFADEWINNIIANVPVLDDPTENSSSGFSYNYNNIFNSWSSSLGTNSSNIDPNFIDNVDFVPQGALKIGTVLSAVPTDINELERANPPTLGLVEI